MLDGVSPAQIQDDMRDISSKVAAEVCIRLVFPAPRCFTVRSPQSNCLLTTKCAWTLLCVLVHRPLQAAARLSADEFLRVVAL